MVPVLVPEFAQAAGPARLATWLKPNGARVRAGEPILSIRAGTLAIEVEAPVDGVLSRRSAEGAAVEIGALVAEIG